MELTIVDLIKQICSENEPTNDEKYTIFNHDDHSKQISKFRQNVKKYMKIWIASTTVCMRVLSDAIRVELPHFGIFSKLLNSICFTPNQILSQFQTKIGIANSNYGGTKAKTILSLIGNNLHVSTSTVDSILNEISKAFVHL
jgi:hypothetical protein